MKQGFNRELELSTSVPTWVAEKRPIVLTTGKLASSLQEPLITSFVISLPFGYISKLINCFKHAPNQCSYRNFIFVILERTNLLLHVYSIQKELCFFAFRLLHF